MFLPQPSYKDLYCTVLSHYSSVFASISSNVKSDANIICGKTDVWRVAHPLVQLDASFQLNEKKKNNQNLFELPKRMIFFFNLLHLLVVLKFLAAQLSKKKS